MGGSNRCKGSMDVGHTIESSKKLKVSAPSLCVRVFDSALLGAFVFKPFNVFAAVHRTQVSMLGLLFSNILRSWRLNEDGCSSRGRYSCAETLSFGLKNTSGRQYSGTFAGGGLCHGLFSTLS